MSDYRELLRSTSRTFAVGIEALPAELREAVTLAYLVLRVSDYFEDSPSLPPDGKRHYLRRWGSLLREGSGRSAGGEAQAAALLEESVAPEDRELPDFLAAREAGSVLRGLAALPEGQQEVIRRHTAATTFGMADWAERGADFPDERALDAYMFEVAGRVGLLLTELFAAHSPRIAERAELLGAHAVSFGLGLQTVNVIRGLHEDPDRGWTYLPRAILRTGSRPRDLRTLSPEDRTRILEFLVRKAGRHEADAFRYCQLLPRRERGIRIFCIVPALIASRTAAAARGRIEAFEEPVKVGRAEVGRLVLKARLLYFSNGWLERERECALAMAG